MTLGQAVADSVGAHMIADVEVGVFLSGGTDSTLLAALASEINPDLRTFTLSFPEDPAIDESDLASANATLLGTKHETIPVHAADMHEAARLVTSSQGEPFGDAGALPLAVLAREARREIKVALSGEGADELFGGYKRYRVSRWLQNPLFSATKLATRPFARMYAGRRGGTPGERATEALLWGGGVKSHAALLVGELNVLPEGGPVSEAAILARSDWAAAENGHGERVTARDFDLKRWLPNVYMEKTDRATMASGLEARVPYLDPAVAAVAERSVRRSFGKGALREELERRVPGVSLPDQKKGMAVPYQPLLAGLREHARRELRSRDSILSRFLGPEAVRALRERCARSVTTEYRVATIGLWDEVFSGTTFT
jgi:asparagine synthase (glutamine-hydrolysing)